MCKSNLHLAIFGGGGEIEKFRSLSESLGILGKRVFFCERVNFHDLFASIYGADFGIIPNIRGHVNGTMVSSSKMFDYIQTQMPFVADMGLEIQRLLDQFDVGKAVDFQQEAKEIAPLLDQFCQDVLAGAFLKTELKRAKQEVVWPPDIVEKIYPGRIDRNGKKAAETTPQRTFCS